MASYSNQKDLSEANRDADTVCLPTLLLPALEVALPPSLQVSCTSSRSLVAHKERKVYERNYSDLLLVLPPEIGTEMYQNGWLLFDEYQVYKQKTGNPREQREVLLQCLMRQKEGTLMQFCELLRQFPSTVHIADKLIEDYKEGMYVL